MLQAERFVTETRSDTSNSINGIARCLKALESFLKRAELFKLGIRPYVVDRLGGRAKLARLPEKRRHSALLRENEESTTRACECWNAFNGGKGRPQLELTGLSPWPRPSEPRISSVVPEPLLHVMQRQRLQTRTSTEPKKTERNRLTASDGRSLGRGLAEAIWDQLATKAGKEEGKRMAPFARDPA
ncbi:hypothetical protein HPB50_009629 [Hyalomma asiaticum]|uniref:Uncharacterized protein n=1 Tax=Hyalomma asiaticum TaxID=266040 RepID=A0ACB7TF97_HYAAI|nr:hypothetical protein HPB50_009629 [Hyalomma asiaticum]